MISGFGWAVLVLIFRYLALFLWGIAIASDAYGRSVRLLGRASGRDRWAAFGFRAAFVVALFGPLFWLAWPILHKADPLWTEGEVAALGAVGVFLAGVGAMVAFAAQMSMGTSWRVGVASDATGDLVSGGLYRFSRNPTFLGQFALLAGVGFAIPSLPTILAPLLFLGSASLQIRSEEAVLRQSLGAEYERYAASVPRWIGLRRRSVK